MHFVLCSVLILKAQRMTNEALEIHMIRRLDRQYCSLGNFLFPHTSGGSSVVPFRMGGASLFRNSS